MIPADVASSLRMLLPDQQALTSSTPQTAPGCMSSNSDPECTAIIPRLGLDFVYQDGSNAPQTYPAAQSTFSAVNR